MTHFVLRRVVSAMALSIAAWTVSTATAYAAPQAPVAELAATVSSEVRQDQVQIVLSVRTQAGDAVKVTQRLNETIEQAKVRLGKPQQVRISTGNVQTYPSYDRQGKITGWQGSADMILQSGDFAAAAATADQVSDLLAVTGVTFSLSDDVRRAEQARLMDSVAAAFREKATTTARVFGYHGYEIQRLNVSESGEAPSFRPMMMAAMAADAQPKAELSLLPGVQTVSVTVNGVIALR